ncbi:hypothetical protein [Kitasatospora sp. McL0602]|uniref:hypothetical protein n=1 Tax=Kitasatospora sp. McL0602 TaxID=3439530 RepID=UPI003F8CB0F0
MTVPRAVAEPSACAHCGIPRREHYQQWTNAVSWHQWASPTSAQILARMKARRAGRTPVPVCRCDEPDADPHECEADDCTMRNHLLGVAGGGGSEARRAQSGVTVVCPIPRCGWSRHWSTVDGSAQEDLYRHTTRAHPATT